MLFATFDLVRYATKTGPYSGEALETRGLWLATRSNAIANGYDDLRAGDMVFYHNSYSIISWAIMLLSSGTISHSAMYAGDGMVYDASTQGFVRHPLADYLDGRGYLAFVRFPGSDDDRNAIAAFAQKQLGAGYNWGGVCRFGLSILLGAHEDYRAKFSFDILLAFGVALALTRTAPVLFIEILVLAVAYLTIVAVNQIRARTRHKSIDELPQPGPEPSRRRVREIDFGKLESGSQHALIRELSSADATRLAAPVLSALARERSTLVSDLESEQGSGYRVVAVFEGTRIQALAGVRETWSITFGRHVLISDLIARHGADSRQCVEELVSWIAREAKSRGLPCIYLERSPLQAGLREPSSS